MGIGESGVRARRARAGPGRRSGAGSGAMLAVGALAALAVVVRIVGLDARSMWSDEIFSVDWARQPAAFLLGAGARIEPTPPFYYLLLKAWIAVFGDGTLAVRALSAACSALVVPVVWSIGRGLLGRRAAAWGALFAAVDPLSLFFAETARGYALLQLAEASMLLGLAEATRPGSNDAARRRGVALFALSAAAAAWIHYSAVFLAACAGLVLAVALAGDRSRVRPLLPALLVMGAASASAIAAAAAFASGLTHSVGLQWMRAPTPRGTAIFLKEVLTTPDQLGHGADLAAIGIVLLAGAGAVGVARRDRRAALILVALPLLYVLVLIGVSFRRPMLLSRCGVVLAVPICLLLGTMVATRPRPLSRGAIAGLALGLFGSLLIEHARTRAVEDWRALARTLVANGACAGPIVTYGPYDFDVLAYAPRLASRRLIVVDEFGQEGTSEGVLNQRVTHARRLRAASVAAFVRADAGAVLVLRAGYRPGAAADTGPIRWTLSRDFAGGLALRCHGPASFSGDSASPPAAGSGS